MNRDNRNNNNRRRNNNSHRQGNKQRSKQNSNRNKLQERRDDNKAVPIKYEPRKTKDPPTVELKYNMNTRVCKESLIVFEDGSPEECLKLVKEFKNVIETYNLWSGVAAEAAAIVYSDFRRCLKGHARDAWDDIVTGQTKNRQNFETHLRSFIKKHLGQNALQNQVLYHKET